MSRLKHALVALLVRSSCVALDNLWRLMGNSLHKPECGTSRAELPTTPKTIGHQRL